MHLKVVSASLIACLVALFSIPPLTSSAAPITVPTVLNPGDQYRLAFVTSTTRDATSTSIADYNAFVTAVATGVPELAALGTTWTVIGSTETVDARDNTNTNPSFSTGLPVYNLGDERVANDNADLWNGSLDASVRYTEAGSLAGTTQVWTGTDTSGVSLEPLGQSPLFISTVGVSFLSNFGWINASAQNNSQVKSLYAISGPLTVVPEPGTIILMCLGTIAVVGCGIRSRRSTRSPRPQSKQKK